jgi:hypothetical protein
VSARGRRAGQRPPTRDKRAPCACGRAEHRSQLSLPGNATVGARQNWSVAAAPARTVGLPPAVLPDEHSPYRIKRGWKCQHQSRQSSIKQLTTWG